MGHVTILRDSVEEALTEIEKMQYLEELRKDRRIKDD